ncbi:MAG: glutamine amidotransferase [Verrucomicrobia bacterium]|nr:glutamine amidotransferase [Verrucomicrobiota bacterium]
MTAKARNADSMKRLRVLYIGDWAFHTGPRYIESPFEDVVKQVGMAFYGQRLKQALEAAGADVECWANWDLYNMEPGGFEKTLNQCDAIVISDVEARCFHLFPDFFDRKKYGAGTLVFPDRLKSLRRFVECGGGLLMLGGWLSFSGHMEKGGWRRCAYTDALPVECLVGEDLVESSAGFQARVKQAAHPITKGLKWSSFQPILGYNEVRAKNPDDVLVDVKETGHPLMVASTLGKGRQFLYMSDPVPHWGINFELWSDYDRFWKRALLWSCGRLGA